MLYENTLLKIKIIIYYIKSIFLHQQAIIKLKKYRKQLELNKKIYQENTNNCTLIENSSVPSVNKPWVLFNYSYKNNDFNVDNFSCNLGDYIQTIATKKILNKIGYNNHLFHDRDNLVDIFNSNIIMQGWFAHSINFIPNKTNTPIFIGTHFTKNIQAYFDKIEKYKNIFPFKGVDIGCRDLFTLQYLKSKKQKGIDINPYLSRCLTLTLPKRNEQKKYDKIFFVDLTDDILKYIPKNIQEKGITVQQKEVFDGKYDLEKNWNFYYQKAEKLLNLYKNEAKLVITTALHCASPCIAMGIPTILISNNKEEQMTRFSALDGIVTIYTLDDIKNRQINFYPEIPHIEDLKHYMLKNLELSILKTMGKEVNEQELAYIRNIIETWKSN
ncbi:polysaccharide pyruvyl transferase family protein [Campylobacter sp. RKI_CA19_01121]|uniref:polysaccharide pyruvyl transferase family protein n=1 Tax=Campylobacter sp. RKI_CA19_01121 TaxID=2911626 RepID=UPI0021E7CD7B|nr:polysaccharide pyruvyl transferase family protein [Campylobacter sp. RKI_CA19_01121]MCV3336935.1 polysaccharide pyruvyl transferase family protein [Campylobacter sp. RKI_CA19_01121]